jgi:hypothetical protein
MARQPKRKANAGLIATAVCGAIAVAAGGAWGVWILRTGMESTGTLRNSAAEGEIYQDGRIVGLGLGAKIVSADQIEFAEIKNTAELNVNKEIEFDRRSWKIHQVRQLIHSSASQPGTSMMRVVARIVPKLGAF